MAIHYYNSKKKFLLSTNFKVWFSTLEKQRCLRRINTEFVLKNISAPKKTIREHFLLVRNPYERAESFFKDKFRKHPQLVDISPHHNWQNCQKIFFPFINVNETENFEIRDALLSVSFRQFISFLPEVYTFDAHLTPQYLAFFIHHNNHFFQIPYNRCLQVEKAENLLFIKRDLSLDITIKENPTDEMEWEIDWGQREKETIKKLYQNDFELFDYNDRKNQS